MNITAYICHFCKENGGESSCYKLCSNIFLIIFKINGLKNSKLNENVQFDIYAIPPINYQVVSAQYY